MDASRLAGELLDALPAHRALGLRVVSAVGGVGVVEVADVLPVANVIGALHSSGVTALADAAALAAVLSAAPDEATGRRLQPLGTRAEVAFRRPVRGRAVGSCALSAEALGAVAALSDGYPGRTALTTVAVISGDGEDSAAAGTFDWTVRLGPV